MQKEKEAFAFFKVEVCSAEGGGWPLAGRVYLTLLRDGDALLPEFLLAAPVAPEEPRFEAGATQTFVHRLPLADAAVTAAKIRYRVAGAWAVRCCAAACRGAAVLAGAMSVVWVMALLCSQKAACGGGLPSSR